jgi:hypothetical protein
MQQLAALAAADFQKITAIGAGIPYTLIDKSNAEYPVVGTYNDVGFLIDAISGEAIQGRTIEATCPASVIIELAGKVPERGWKARVTGYDKKTYTLFVQRNEYDRTIGVCRFALGLKLKETENAE